MTHYISLAAVTLYCMGVGLVGYLLGQRERAERKRRVHLCPHRFNEKDLP